MCTITVGKLTAENSNNDLLHLKNEEHLMEIYSDNLRLLNLFHF